MRVLVTGGSGFIGSHVIDKLADRGHEPVIYDLRPSPWHSGVAGVESIETVIGSISDQDALRDALTGCDAVAHLAAVADVNDVHADPAVAERINASGTVAVLEACRQSDVERVVYASTIWVYSDCAETDVDEDTLLPPPSHLYTSTKLAGELYCRSYQELFGIDYTILRFGIPYGPRAREAAVIPAFVNKAFQGEPLTLAGDGLQSRRFVYVEDLADGVVCGLAEVARNRVYNLASEENVTIRQIAETVQELVGNTEIVFTPARPGDFGGKVVSSDRALAELGWSASTPFEEGVRRYVDWRREQAALAEQRVQAAVIPAGEPDAEARPRHVLIISADIGEGHDLPARAVAREFRDEDPDAQVSVVNGLPAMGPVMTGLLRDNSAFMFRWVPWLFDLQYRLFMNFAPTRWTARRLLTFFGKRGLLRLIRAHDPDVIVSTYPGVTAILGELRRRGALGVPCYSSITDLAGLQYWAHPGIDLHFITHPESTEEVERIAGPASVRWAKPPTSPAFLTPRSRAEARKGLGLPVEGTVIGVSGGGWGVGDLIGATQAALEVPDATVLCLCGRNDEIRRRVSQRFPGDPRLKVMGFTDRMGDVLAAADVLIHSSAGLTVLEAIIRGCPVISYGFGYGHVNASNHALERFGLAQVARRQRDIAPALERALAGRPAPDESFAKRPSTASLVLGNERRARSLPAWRVRTVHAVTAGLTAALLAVWSMTAGMAFSLVSAIAHPQLTHVTTARPEVGVMIDAEARQVPTLARATSAEGVRVSFAVTHVTPESAYTAAYAAALFGDEALPRLPDGGLFQWLHTKPELRHMLRELGWGRHFLYASSGPSLGQWLFAHGAGGRLVAGAVRLSSPRDHLAHLHAGEVIELRVANVDSAAAQLRLLYEALERYHLSAVPVTQLLRDSGTPV